MKKLFIFYFGSTLAWAAPDINIHSAQPDLPSQSAVKISAVLQHNEPITLNDELRQQPELTRLMINRAIDSRQFHLLPTLLDIYQQTPNPDWILMDYAKGILQAAQRNFSKAIDLYSKILEHYPQFHPVRLRLAQALFENHQNHTALAQFQWLQQQRLPEEICTFINQYFVALQQRNRWQFHFGFNYLQENNVNNASNSPYVYIGNVAFKKDEKSLPQKANGLNYHFSLAKNWHLSDQHVLHLENQFQGKSYWNNHSFDEQQNRFSFGYQWQNANQRLALLPFYGQRWFANHRYNHSYGVRAESTTWLTSKWQFSLAGEVEKLNHRTGYEAIDGTNLLASNTLLYAFNADSYVYLGGDWLQEKLLEPSQSSVRRLARLGWGQKWWGGISTRIQLNYGKRQFAEQHRIFPKKRQDKEWDFTFSLWHSKIHFWEVTPKITFNYHRVNSNIPDLYSYKRSRVYLDFEKTF